MRDPLLSDVAVPEPDPGRQPAVQLRGKTSGKQGGKKSWPWGGLSGAVAFYQGWALGVVVQHHPGRAPRPCGSSHSNGWPEPSSPEARRVADALGIPPDRPLPWACPDPQRILSGALDRARRLVPRDGLVQRETELADLDAWVRSEPWVWIGGQAFAGKSALLATFAASSPPGLAVACCFIRRGEGKASMEYVLDALSQQLACLAADVVVEVPDDREVRFAQVLEDAAASCARRGDRLVVVIDGLDEYDPQATRSLAAWLPVELPDDVTMVAAGRESVRGALPGHPLVGHRHELAQSPWATEALREATAEFTTALRGPDVTARATLAHLAAVGGGLSADDLVQLLSLAGLLVSSPQLHAVVRFSLDRTVVADPPSGTASPALNFTHETYPSVFCSLAEPDEIPRARRTVDAWVDDYRARGWPAETPLFAFDRYVSHLRDRAAEVTQAQDARTIADRLYRAVASPHRWLATFRATGSPVPADAASWTVNDP